jgi:hypothetical protein
VNQSEIVRLREPAWGGASNVWDIVYAEQSAAEAGMDVFSDLVQIDQTNFVAAGSFTKDKADSTYKPLLVKYDERLKPVWVIRQDVPTKRTIHRILKADGGFTVLGDLHDPKQGDGFYIGAYGEDGKEKRAPASVFEKGGDLDAKTIIPAQDGGGYIVAAQFIDAEDSEKQHGILYKISKAGKVVWKRSYKPGQSTVFNNVQATLDGNYVISGQIVLENEKGAGWLLKVDRRGAIQWQRTYPRGLSAGLQAAAQSKSGEFIVSGRVRPFDHAGQGLTAWVMKADSAGNPVWQRFIRGDYDYQAPDLIVYEDGRISVLLAAGAVQPEQRAHARLVTLSPQGQMHHVEDFTEGQNAAGYRLIAGLGGERIIVGYAQTSFPDTEDGADDTPESAYTYDGWLLAGVPLDTFNDPCAASDDLSPILP